VPKKGQTMLYRPVPRGFPETFVRVGWGGIEKEFHAHAKTIKRWMIICGREALIKARADFVRENRHKRRRAYGD
jgi:hypothetical protein